MNLPLITSELKQLLDLVSQWKSTSNIPDIEREIATDKVKLIYAQLRNISTPSTESNPVKEVAEVTAPVASSSNLQGVFYEIQEEPSEKFAPIPTFRNQPSTDIEELVIPDFQPFKSTRVKEEEPKRLTVEEASPILESISSLVDTINSNAKAAEVIPEPALKPTEVKKEEVVLEYMPTPVAEAPKVEKKEAQNTKVESHRLGDTYEGTKTFLNEVLSPNRQQDLASKLQHNHIEDLRKAISFNDKFYLIKELFKGDAHAYEEAITALNSCTSIDQAIIYIQEHHSWDASSAAANLLVDLLQRRFI